MWNAFPLKTVQTYLISRRPSLPFLQSLWAQLCLGLQPLFISALRIGSCYLKQLVASTGNTQARYTGLALALLEFIEKSLHGPKHCLILLWMVILLLLSDDHFSPMSLLAFMWCPFEPSLCALLSVQMIDHW